MPAPSPSQPRPRLSLPGAHRRRQRPRALASQAAAASRQRRRRAVLPPPAAPPRPGPGEPPRPAPVGGSRAAAWWPAGRVGERRQRVSREGFGRLGSGTLAAPSSRTCLKGVGPTTRWMDACIADGGCGWAAASEEAWEEPGACWRAIQRTAINVMAAIRRDGPVQVVAAAADPPGAHHTSAPGGWLCTVAAAGTLLNSGTRSSPWQSVQAGCERWARSGHPCIATLASHSRQGAPGQLGVITW